MTTPDPLVSADYVLEHINAPDIRVVEATWFPDWVPRRTSARQHFDAGHIPGAVFFDIDDIADPDTDLPHMLPSAELFSSRVRKLGLGDGHRIILYDRNDFFASARAWWMFRTMGHDDVRVLNGGFEAWRAAGGDTDDLPSPVRDRHHTVRMRADLVRTADQVDAARASGQVQLVDARPSDRFAGRAPEPRAGLKSGHIPGSLNLPHSRLLDDGQMRSVEDLEAIFDEHEIDPLARTIATCGSGVSAAIVALAMARIGNDLVSVYDGSWAEWGAGDREIAQGDATAT